MLQMNTVARLINRYSSRKKKAKETMQRVNTSGLPDHIDYGLKILFVGINPSLRSAQLGHHYAGHSNRFWKLLNETKYIDVPLTYHDDWRLPEWKYGLTNIVDRPTAGIQELTAQDYRNGRTRLLAKVEHYQPRIIALLGITVKNMLLSEDLSTSLSKTKNKTSSPIGLQHQNFGRSLVFVLPNPSGRNAYYSFQKMIRIFRQLRRLSKNIS